MDSKTDGNATYGTPLWHRYPDDEEALELLTKMGCPAPCVGEVNETGWHRECQLRGVAALAVLRGWVKSDG